MPTARRFVYEEYRSEAWNGCSHCLRVFLPWKAGTSPGINYGNGLRLIGEALFDRITGLHRHRHSYADIERITIPHTSSPCNLIIPRVRGHIQDRKTNIYKEFVADGTAMLRPGIQRLIDETRAIPVS